MEYADLVAEVGKALGRRKDENLGPVVRGVLKHLVPWIMGQERSFLLLLLCLYWYCARSGCFGIDTLSREVSRVVVFLSLRGQ